MLFRNIFRGIRVIGPASKSQLDPAQSILGDPQSTFDVAEEFSRYQKRFDHVPDIGGHRIR